MSYTKADPFDSWFTATPLQDMTRKRAREGEAVSLFDREETMSARSTANTVAPAPVRSMYEFYSLFEEPDYLFPPDQGEDDYCCNDDGIYVNDNVNHEDDDHHTHYTKKPATEILLMQKPEYYDPESDLPGGGFPLEFDNFEGGIVELKRVAKEKGFNLHVKKRSVFKRRACARLVCSVQKCPFVIVLKDVARHLSQIDQNQTCFVHRGHTHVFVPTLVQKKEEAAVADFSEVRKAVSKSKTAEDKRLSWVSSHPSSQLLHGMMNESFGVSDVTKMTTFIGLKDHDPADRGEDLFHTQHAWRLDRRGSKPNLCTTEAIPDKDTFVMYLRDEDRAYFEWWYQDANSFAECSLMKSESDKKREAEEEAYAAEQKKLAMDLRDDSDEDEEDDQWTYDNVIVFLRVMGTSAIDLQKSLLRMQVSFGVLNHGSRTGDGSRTHAVFSSPFPRDRFAYLAINKYCLRAMRMVSYRYIPEKKSFPLAPLLIQAWMLSPVNDREASVRKFGIYSVMQFIGRNIHRPVCKKPLTSCKCLLPVDHPQFGIYERFPEFLKFYWITDEYMYDSIRKSHINGKEFSEIDSFYNVVAAYVFQARRHYVWREHLESLWNKFFSGSNATALQLRYPIHWALIQHLKAHIAINEVWIPIDIGGWKNLLYLPRGMSPPRDEIYPHILLYDMLFEEELLPEDLRWDLGTRIVIQVSKNLGVDTMKYTKPMFVQDTFGDSLMNYEDEMVRPVPNPSWRMKPFSTVTSNIWPLKGLFLFLREIQHLSWNWKSPLRLSEDEALPRVRLGDPAIFACTHVNMPVACVTSPDITVIYSEDFMVTWNGVYGKNADMALLEAYVLVRNHRFYAEQKIQIKM